MSSASTGGTEGSSPASSPASAASQAMAAPKYGTLVPNRIFVGGISASTSEAELAQLFSTYGNVKATKIILDRAGVSKGYGFVTFETEEEAKRLQQETECIVLRERKLNIAPAIKKQPFNRSFDGGAGSPPAVQTSPYYYANGMSLPYQNGLTFYNAGAPTPGAPLAAPADPAALYQAAGVFAGPQAASAHQTFAPMMYPCPAPSLYMPQQYQYSPMPYETYYAGAAGQPQYLYSAGNGTSNGNTNSASASSAAAATTSVTGATSPLSNPAHHYYQPTSGLATATPVNHHHHHHHSHHGNVPSGGAPQSSVPQLDQLYYNFSIGPAHHQHSQVPPHQPPSIIGDHHQQQQLLVYTNDCQQTDGQIKNQEETCSTSSHSQSGSHHHHHHQTTQSTVNETHNTTTQSTIATTTTTTTTATTTTAIPALMPLMPLKYPHPYTNYSHPLNLPSPQQQPHQQQQQFCLNDSDESMHCRTILYHPVYIQNSNNPGNTSLLPTPPSPFDAQRTQHYHQTTPQKYISYTNSRSQNGYAIFNPSTIQHSPQFNKYQNPKNERKSHMNNYNNNNNNNNNRRNPINSSSYLLTPSPKSGNLLSQKTLSNYDYGNVRRNLNYDFSTNRKNYNSNFKIHTTKDGKMNNYDERIVCNTLTSPPPPPYSPLIRPIPNYSPTNIQVQYNQTRYQNHGIGSTTINNHQQQQQQSRRYGTTISGQVMNMGRKQNDKYATTSNNQGLVIRANNNKQKVVNGMMQINSKNNIDDDEQRSGGGGGGSSNNDSQQSVLTRMPLTPPGTPRNLQDNQISDNCHQLQALTL